MNNDQIKNVGLKYYLSRHKMAVFGYIFLTLLAVASEILLTILSAKAIALITVAKYHQGIKVAIFALSMVCVRRIMWWNMLHIYYKYSTIICSEMSIDLTKRCFLLSSSTFAENNSGIFMQRIMNDPATVLNSLATIVDTFGQIVSSGVVLVYILFLNWIIGLIYIAIISGLMVLETIRRRISRNLQYQTRKINDDTYGFVTEVVKSERDIKALDLEHKLKDMANTNFNKLQKSSYRTSMLNCHMWSAKDFIIELTTYLALILGVFLLKNERMILSTYILIFSYRGNIHGLVHSAGTLSQIFTDISVHSSRMFALYDDKIYPTEKFGDKTIPNPKGEITFNNVEFAYSEVVEEEENKKKIFAKRKEPKKHIKKTPIFTNLSFKIKPKTTVAFVGKSGSGKSTILSLIAKLIEVDSGEILIDNVNINELSKDCLRSNIALINQFPYIFDMSIRDNLLLVKKDASEEELWDVLEKACFAEDVKAMSKGLDTKIGETGIKLSGGQRQRLSIARALLKNSKIIIFDESTSSLDNFAQSHVQKSIEKMKGKHTIVIVAHRLSTIKNVDTIYFLDNGKIINHGNFEKLFNTDKQFQDMFMIENI